MTIRKTQKVYFQWVLPFSPLPATLSGVSTSNPDRDQSLDVSRSNTHERAKKRQGNQEKTPFEPKGKKSCQEREAGQQKMIPGLLVA